MIKYLLAAAILFLATARTYPLYKQCDSKWGSEHLGTSSKTICQAGCAMSSLAMGLAGIGKNYNPSTLNTWLKGHGGYVSGDLLVWGSVTSLGLSFIGKVANSQIAPGLSAGHVVILNVHNGGHWVLATGISGSKINVHDPGFSTSSYDMSEIVAGQTAMYRVSGSQNPVMFLSLMFTIIPCDFGEDLCVYDEYGHLFIERVDQFFISLFNNWILIILSIFGILATSFSNASGLTITKYYEALMRCLISICKTVGVWIIGLIISFSVGDN